ncbi:13749_t:CDS:2 [Funneliformis caledonium]|uniref:13749_t:CDS:1 n=2 Tax=Funneliformis TaxID=1117308 RepID=A0A9N8YQG0_9GLOM|nr:13749_t:CDS:2 [Funneliformis caledonium]CAG8522550.1 16421_t:CDS:2 [Funneliformis mosseae]
MALVFFSGICWIFCCGSCVGRDTLRAIGLGSPAFTEEEEWEMFEEGADVNNNVDEESVWDNNQETFQ